MLTIDQLLQESERIEPVPQVIHQLMDLAEDPETPTAEITELILYEPVVTAKLLRLANSAAFGFRKKIDSVHDAVVLLGLKRVVEIILLASVTKPLKSAHDGYGLAEGQLWKQSVACALIASAIADAVDASLKHVVFTAALLKDIGVVVMDRHVRHVNERIHRGMQAHRLDLVTAERQVLGIDHARLGGQMAVKWNFSDTLAATIRDHHLADLPMPPPPETAMVYLADCMCAMSGINAPLFCGSYAHYDRMLAQLQLSETRVNGIMSDFYARKEDIYGLLAIM